MADYGAAFMKSSYIFGLIFLGYFQLFAQECPLGKNVHVAIFCEAGKEQLTLSTFEGYFQLDEQASKQLVNVVNENYSQNGFVCVYRPKNYHAVYSLNSENVIVTSHDDILNLLNKVTDEDANFPAWYSHIGDLLEPEFRHIEGVPTTNLEPFRKYNLKIGLGMNFNGKIALEKQTGSYRMASNSGLNPDNSLYIIAQQCIAQITSEKNPNTENFCF